MSIQTNNSQNSRKGGLWNIVEPGDPYDIRKSMIAKFPGQKTRFMGQDLELVCLLQAAEIERLCDYLQDFRLRYRQLERRTQIVYGDRHSYEVQIKELTEQLAQESNFRIENQKMKNYVKGLMQSQGSKNLQWQQHIKIYEQRIIAMSIQRQQMNKKINQYQTINKNIFQQLQTYRTKFQQLQKYVQKQISVRINNYEQTVLNLRRQNQDLRRAQNSMSGDNHRIVNDYEIKIKSITSSYQQRLSIIIRQNEDIKRSLTEYRDSNINLNRQIESIRLRFTETEKNLQNELRLKVNNYEQQITSLTNANEELKRRTLMDKDRLVAEYQTKIANMSQQIERLAQITRTKTQQLMNWQNRNKSMQIDLQNSRMTITELQNLLKQEKPKIGNYESTITILNREKQNMQRSIVELQNQNGQLIRRVNYLQNDKRNLQSSVELLRRNINETQLSITREWQSKVTLYQQKVIGLTSENQNYKRKTNELGNANQNLMREIQQYRRKFMELQGTVTHDLQVKISNYEYTISSYENKINVFSQENQELRRKVMQVDNYTRRLAEYQNKIHILQAQIDRLNQIIRSKMQQDSNSQSQIKVIQFNYEQRLAIISKEAEEYRLKTIDLENMNRNVMMQLQSNKTKIRELENSIGTEWQRKISVFESRITNYTEENNNLKRKIVQLQGRTNTIPQYENKLSLLNQQIERLSQTIKIKIEQANVSNMRLQSTHHELQEYKRKFNELQRTSYSQKSEFQLSISNYENRVVIITKQNEDLKKHIAEYELRNLNLQNELQSQMKRISQIQGNFSHEWQNKMVTYEKSIGNFAHENEQLRIQLSEYETTKLNLLKDIESYKRKITSLQTAFNEEFQGKITTYEQRISIITNENDDLRRRTNEYQLTNRNIVQQLEYHKKRFTDLVTEFEIVNKRYSELQMTTQRDSREIISSYEHKISIFTKQNEQLRKRVQEGGEMNRKISEYQNKIAFFSQQIQRLNQFLQIQSQQRHQWHNRTTMIQKELENYRQKYGQLESTSQFQSQKTATYLRENQQLKRKLSQLQSSIQLVNFELENQKRKIIQYENSIQYEWKSKISNYEHRVSILTRENEQFRNQINNEQSSSSYKIAEYENKIAMLSQEIERLILTNRGKTDQLNSVEMSSKKMQSEIEELKRRIGLAQGEHSTEYQQLYDSYILIHKEYQNCKITLKQYEKSIKKLYSQFEQLQNILQTLRKQNYSLKTQKLKTVSWLQKNKILSAEIERLTQLYEEQKKSLEEYKLKISDSISLEKRLSEQMALMVVLFVQIQTLRKKVKQKENQVNDSRRSSLVAFKSS